MSEFRHKVASRVMIFSVVALLLAAVDLFEERAGTAAGCEGAGLSGATGLVPAAFAGTGGDPLSPTVCPDFLDLTAGATLDCDHNGVDDQVEFDRGTAFDTDGNGVLDKCEPVPGDVDHDDAVGINDGRMLSFAVGSVEGVHSHFIFSADLNEDHRIDSADVAIWGRLWKAANGTSLACSDSSDNDGDGATDFPADAGCADAVSDLENPKCDDGIDNDGDGATDFPADAGCAAASSAEEE